MTIGNNFYNLNSTRGYPLDDAATGQSDAGLHMPNGLIVDLCLRFPAAVGQYAYFSAVHVSESLVSIAISAANSLDTSVLNPIATLVLPQPVNEGQVYQLIGTLPGVAGWAVFGKLTTLRYVGAFSTARQGLLAQLVARSYAAFPVPYATKQDNEYQLQGIVKLIAGSDLQIAQQQRSINGQTVTAIVFQLANTSTQLLTKYTGPCGGRPESNTCAKPAIEGINTVTPDPVTGNIEIAFPDMLVTNMPNGMLVSTSLSLPAICPTSATAGLSTPLTDLCLSEISEDSSVMGLSESDYFPDFPSESGSYALPGQSSSDVLIPDYPLCMRFYADQPVPFTPVSGLWQLQTFPEFNYVTCPGVPDELSTQRRMYSAFNTGDPFVISLFNNPAYLQNTNIVIQTTVQTSNTATGQFGLVLDYRRVSDLPYFTAVFVDLTANQFTIQKYAGTVWLPPVAVMPFSTPQSFIPNTWFDIAVTITDSLNPGRVDISASVEPPASPTTPGSGGTVQALSVSGYGINDGSFGFFASQAFTYNTQLYVDTVV